MYKDHVWSYDFVQDRTHDGRAFRMLTLIDEYTRECLAIDVARRLTGEGNGLPQGSWTPGKGSGGQLEVGRAQVAQR